MTIETAGKSRVSAQVRARVIATAISKLKAVKGKKARALALGRLADALAPRLKITRGTFMQLVRKSMQKTTTADKKQAPPRRSSSKTGAEGSYKQASTKSKKHKKHATALHDAGVDEDAFKKAFGRLKDANLSKETLETIAGHYGVRRGRKGASAAKVLDSIERHFYFKRYNHDADKMAARATPW